MQTPPTTPTHQYSTPQSLIDSYSGRADGPRAPNANSPPLHLKAHEPRKLVVLEARAVERERDAARQRQSQRDAVFRHRRRRVGRDPEHLDPEPRRGLDVDAVEPRAPQRDQADAAGQAGHQVIRPHGTVDAQIDQGAEQGGDRHRADPHSPEQGSRAWPIADHGNRGQAGDAEDYFGKQGGGHEPMMATRGAADKGDRANRS